VPPINARIVDTILVKVLKGVRNREDQYDAPINFPEYLFCFFRVDFYTLVPLVHIIAVSRYDDDAAADTSGEWWIASGSMSSKPLVAVLKHNRTSSIESYG
jgi:hypothetical protein